MRVLILFVISSTVRQDGQAEGKCPVCCRDSIDCSWVHADWYEISHSTRLPNDLRCYIGIDNGLMGGLIGGKAFNDTFNSPDSVIIGTMVSILEVGAFFGSIATAIFGDKLGRRKSIILGTTIMAIGSLLQATAYTRAHMIVARVIAGVGLGINNSTVPVMQSEYSPKASRGLYVCMQLSTLNFGIFLVYWIDYAFSYHTQSFAWRIPVILQEVFLFAMIILAFLVDDTPRWLAAHDRTDEAFEVLARLNDGRHTPEETTIQFNDILNVIRIENSIATSSWKKVLKSDNISSWRRFFIACGIQFMQQAGGINSLVYVSGRPILSPAKSTQLTILPVCRNPLRKVHRLQPTLLQFNVRLPEHMVLRCILHTMAAHRPDRPPTVAAQHDLRHGLGHGCTSSAYLSSTIQHSRCTYLWHCCCSNAVRVSGGFHCWVSGDCLGG